MPKNSVRSRSVSACGVISCAVTTTDSTSPCAERIGVALTISTTLRPSGNSAGHLLVSNGLSRVQQTLHREALLGDHLAVAAPVGGPRRSGCGRIRPTCPNPPAAASPPG